MAEFSVLNALGSTNYNGLLKNSWCMHPNIMWPVNNVTMWNVEAAGEGKKPFIYKNQAEYYFQIISHSY